MLCHLFDKNKEYKIKGIFVVSSRLGFHKSLQNKNNIFFSLITTSKNTK